MYCASHLKMEFCPWYNETPLDEIKTETKLEINETEENVRNGLKSLRDFLKREGIRSKTDDVFLMWFLRAQKYNIKKSQEKLKRYCAMRRSQRELFEGTNIDKIREVLDQQMVGLLPYRDKQGRVILFTRGCAYSPEKMELNDIVRCAVFLAHYSLSFPLTSIRGFSYIADTNVNSMRDSYSLFRLLMSHISTVTSMPCRLQRVDVVNELGLFRHLYSITKPLLPIKITKRVFMIGTNWEMLKENYPPSIRPYEFGGSMGPLSSESYREKFLEFVQKMKTESDFFMD